MCCDRHVYVQVHTHKVHERSSTKARVSLSSGPGWVAAQRKPRGGGDPLQGHERPLVGVNLSGSTHSSKWLGCGGGLAGSPVDLLLRVSLCCRSLLLSWRPSLGRWHNAGREPLSCLPPQISHCVLSFPPEVLMLEGRPDLPLQVDQMAQLSI